MPSPREGKIEVTRKDAIYRGSYLVKAGTVIVRFGNARGSAPLEGSESHEIAQKILAELRRRACIQSWRRH